jgi:hypothetical protein
LRKEELEAITSLLDSPIAFQPSFAHICGDACAGLMLSQLYYWASPKKDGTTKTSDPDGWIYKAHSEWFVETGLRRRQVDRCRQDLEDLGLIETIVRTVKGRSSNRMHYRLNPTRLLELLQSAQNVQSMRTKRAVDRAKACSQLHENAKPIRNKEYFIDSTERGHRSESEPPILGEQDDIKAAAARFGR